MNGLVKIMNQNQTILTWTGIKMKWAKCPMCKGFGSERIYYGSQVDQRACRLCSTFKVRGKIPSNLVVKLNQLSRKENLGEFYLYLKSVITRGK